MVQAVAAGIGAMFLPAMYALASLDWQRSPTSDWIFYGLITLAVGVGTTLFMLLVVHRQRGSSSSSE
jgi:hypothetical protein